MIVVDSNVIAYLWIRHEEAFSRLAGRVREIDNVSTAPRLWKSEFRNVLASQIRFRSMKLRDAKRIVLKAEAPSRIRIVPVQSIDVLDLVDRARCSAYDAEYAAAANLLGTRLVTGDRKLAEASPETAVTTEAFERSRPPPAP